MIELIFAAIMAAEERRKQKEQIKILKQQVGVLLTSTICWQIFSFFIYMSIVPVITAENAEFFFLSLKCDFSLHYYFYTNIAFHH